MFREGPKREDETRQRSRTLLPRPFPPLGVWDLTMGMTRLTRFAGPLSISVLPTLVPIVPMHTVPTSLDGQSGPFLSFVIKQ